MNGSLPSQATCDEAGIDAVRIVLSPSSTSETRLTSPELTFACAAGFFDTGVERILDAGALSYRWQALDATGHVVLESRPYSVVVQRDVEVVFMPVDFLRRAPISVAVAFRFAGDVGFTSCAGAFVDTLQWSLHAGDASGPTLAVAAAGTTCTESLTIPESTILTWTEGPATLVVAASATDGAAWAAQCALTLPYGGPTTVTCDVPRAP